MARGTRDVLMKMLFTIGTAGRHDDEFIAVLKQHHVDAVIDIRLRPEATAGQVRLRNEGRHYRFASGKHIKALCEANGIAYRHDTRFSPTAEMLDRHRTDHDWAAYERAYRALIVERDMPPPAVRLTRGFGAVVRSGISHLPGRYCRP